MSPDVSVAQNNPQSMLTPAPSTMAVNSNSSLAQQVAALLTTGAGAFNAQQIQNVLAQAQVQGKPLFVPQSLVSKAQVKAKSNSAQQWLLATGIGVAVLSVFAVAAMKRR
jgi:hypothetical protein